MIRLLKNVLPPTNWRTVRRLSTIFECVDDGSLATIPIEHIRNFSVIAHVDHGKSTLSDAILALTGNIGESDRKKGQVLDTLKVERERGITVKAQTASMVFNDKRNGHKYLLNLIDTPGHIDFSYEGLDSELICIFGYLAETNWFLII